MRSMPTEIKKNRPDDQMTSCFLKLYTPTRVCEIIIRNWSAGQLVSPKKPDDIRRNGRKKKGERRLSDGTMDIRRRKTRSRNSRAQDTEGRRGSRNDARKMHREKPAFNAGEWKKGKPDSIRHNGRKKKGNAASQTAQWTK